jgi:hypothetical protein
MVERGMAVERGRDTGDLRETKPNREPQHVTLSTRQSSLLRSQFEPDQTFFDVNCTGNVDFAT